MSTPRDIGPEDLTLFAMQLLSREETEEVAAFLAQSSEARRELAQIQGDLAIYAHTVDLHSPPAQARERLLKQVAREKKPVPIDRPATEESASRVGSVYGSASDTANESFGQLTGRGTGLGTGSNSYLTEDEVPRRSVAARVFPWVGWAIAAGLAVAAGGLYYERGNLYHERDSLHATVADQAAQLDRLTTQAAAAQAVVDTLNDTTAMRVTLSRGKEAPAPQGRATYVASKGALIFLANNLQPLPPLKTYELWLIPAAAGSTPIPAGTFRPDEHGDASVILPPLLKGVDAKAFGVTIEDKDGATTPTLPIILVGA
jgi:cell division protein FtsB